MNDILREHACASPLKQADIDAFVADGVHAIALARAWSGDFAPIARSQVIFDSDRFEFAKYVRHGGAPANAYIVAALDQFGDAIDLVAFRPDRHATWLGRAVLLGGEQPFLPRIGDDGLDVHENVVAWLRAERRGVLILNHGRAASILKATGPLRVASTRQARFLRDALTTQPPRIIVREPTYSDAQTYGVAAE